MSLRNIHILFITVSVLLCFVFGFWSFREYRSDGGGFHLAQAVLSLGAAFGLVAYGRWFLTKNRR